MKGEADQPVLTLLVLVTIRIQWNNGLKRIKKNYNIYIHMKLMLL